MVVGTIMNVRSAAKSSHHMQNIKAMYRKSIKENGLTGVACAVKFLMIKNKKVSCKEFYDIFLSCIMRVNMRMSGQEESKEMNPTLEFSFALLRI